MMKILSFKFWMFRFFSGKLNNSPHLKQMQPKSGYDICPGVETEYLKLKDKLNRKPKFS